MHRVTYKEAMDAIVDSFDGDRDKAINWWMKPNSFFDNRVPFKMVKEGDTKELMIFIKTFLCGTIK